MGADYIAELVNSVLSRDASFIEIFVSPEWEIMVTMLQNYREIKKAITITLADFIDGLPPKEQEKIHTALHQIRLLMEEV